MEKHDEGLLSGAFTVPNDDVHCKTKDEAIEHVLFKSSFIPSMFGCRVSSYDQLCLLLDLHSIDHRLLDQIAITAWKD